VNANAAAWALAIDFGTSFTAAAVSRAGHVEVLELDGARRIPSVVCLTEDGGILVGEAAENRAALDPDRVERTPKEYVRYGERTMVLADQQLSVAHVVGCVLRALWDEGLRQHSGTPPERLCLTHPASWSAQRQQLLLDAAADAGLPKPVLLPEPEAAALYLSSAAIGGAQVDDGGVVAVYDLGGGTFDAAVLRRTGDRFELLGEPMGKEALGGEVFDDRLYRRLGEAIDPADWEKLTNSPERKWRRANWDFLRQVRLAKEAVSKASAHPLFVSGANRDLQVTREEFESLIRDDIGVTLDIFQTTLDRAGVRPADLSALYLVGGSSRIPLVAALVRERFGKADTKGEPKTVVALGAAQRIAPVAQTPPKPPPPPRPARPPRTPAAVGATSGGSRSKVVAGTLVALVLAGGGVAAAVSGNHSTDSGGSPVQGYETSAPTDTPTDEPTATVTADPSHAVAGEWSGSLTDSDGNDVDVSLSIATDGSGRLEEDGTDSNGNAYSCSGSLALDHADSDGLHFIYTEEQSANCISGEDVTVSYDQSTQTLSFDDQGDPSVGAPEIQGDLDAS
jgi:hypothetical protein